MIAILVLLSITTTITSFHILPLSGGALQGNYMTTIYIGTPPRPFVVHIDSGSAKLGINCQGCNNCHSHPNPPFDIHKSSTASPLNCNSGSQFCQNCFEDSSPTDKCELHLQYYDKSWISGYFFNDMLSLTSDGSIGASSIIGCINNRSIQFINDKKIDGIWGTGRFTQNVYGQWMQILFQSAEAIKYGADKTYSLCLAHQGGNMVVGGTNPLFHTLSPIIIAYDDPHKDLISKTLTQIRIGETVIHVNVGAIMHDLIIDSGSGGALLDQHTINIITQTISHICTTIGEQCWLDPESNSKCVQLDDINLLGRFPAIELTFGEQHILWHPDEYLNLVDLTYPTYLCFGGDAPPEGQSYLLGAKFMLNKDVVFGQHNISIYPQSNCGGRNLQTIVNSLQMIQVQSTVQQTRQSEDNKKQVLIILGIITPILILAAVITFCYWKKRLQELSEGRQQFHHNHLVPPPPTQVRLGKIQLQQAHKAQQEHK